MLTINIRIPDHVLVISLQLKVRRVLFVSLQTSDDERRVPQTPGDLGL